MNKKFISVFMMGAATLAPLSTLVSCSDYDDDINNLQAQIDASGVNLKEEVSKLQKLLDECKAAAEKADADLEQLSRMPPTTPRAMPTSRLSRPSRPPSPPCRHNSLRLSPTWRMAPSPMPRLAQSRLTTWPSRPANWPTATRLNWKSWLRNSRRLTPTSRRPSKPSRPA